MKVVRWLGAYGKSTTLEASLTFELNRPATDEVCGEGIKHGLSKIGHARVGLLVARKSVIKCFKGDVWSKHDEAGKLVKTRKPANVKIGHTECWCRPNYTALVVDQWTGYTDGHEAHDSAMQSVKIVAAQHGLKVIMVSENGHWNHV